MGAIGRGDAMSRLSPYADVCKCCDALHKHEQEALGGELCKKAINKKEKKKEIWRSECGVEVCWTSVN